MPTNRGAANLRERWPLLIALWVAISSNVATFVLLWPKAEAVDFAVFWRAVHALHPYAANEQPFVYPPTALLWFWPLKFIDVWPGFLVWTAVSVVAFAAAALWLYGRSATALAMISPAMGVGLIPGQTSLIAAALLFASFATKNRLWRGAWLGVLITFKPQVAIFAPLFLIVRRDWVGLFALVLSGCVIVLGATALSGAGIWWSWIDAIPAFQQTVATRGLALSAVSPAAFATALGLSRLLLLVVGCAAAIVVAVKSRALDEGNTAAMVACASLLAAPYGLRYDLIAIAPAMATVILTRSGREALLACVAYAASFGPFSLAASTCVIPWRSPPSEPLKQRRIGDRRG